jgi:glycosyltransferase involved in cell wall biosynthesis
MATERPRVLFFGPDMPGGMSSSIRALLTSPLADEFELEFVPTHVGGAGALTRVRVFGAALARLTWWSLRGRGRVVHVHGTKRGSLLRKTVVVLVAKALRRRVILHLHSGPGDIAAFRASLGRAAVAFLALGPRHADVVINVSAASAAAMAEAFGARDVRVIPNAVPSSPSGPTSPKDGADPLVAYLGGFQNPVKGGEILLAAIAGEGLAGARFALAGPGDAPAAIEPLRADGRVRWEGWLEPAAKDELLREAQVFVLPSTSEGMPMALLEAMAYGLAIVATEVGGVPDTVEAGVEAVLVAPGDPEALRSALAELVADPGERCRLGEAAAHGARRFSPERIAGEIAAVYRELLRDGK